MLAVTAVWFGLLNSARELVKELAIFRRERMVGLNPQSYLLSKVFPLAAWSVIQCMVLLLIVGAKVRMFGLDSAGGLGLMLLILSLTAVCGVLTGLCLSSLSASADQAISLTPVVLIPQVLFSGVFTAIEEGGEFLKGVARLFPTNWAFAGLGRALDLNAKYNASPLTKALVRDRFHVDRWQAIAVLAGIALCFLVLSAALVCRNRGTGR